MPGAVNSLSAEPEGGAARVIAAFVSPASLFRSLAQDTSWWAAFLVLVLAGLIFCFAVQRQVGWDRTYDAILRQNPRQGARMAQMPSAQAAQAKAVGARITEGIAWGFPLVILLSTAVSAAVLLGTLNFAFGGRARYAELFAVYMYASLPFVLHSLLAAAALFAGLDSGSFLISNPVGSNLGYYLPLDVQPWLMALATSLDLFTVWMLALLVLGCSLVARVSRTAAAMAVLGWWVLIVLVKVGAAAVSSAAT